jgi:hypothetical protein
LERSRVNKEKEINRTMDILDQILAAQKGSREEKIQNFNSMFQEDVAVDTANAKAKQVGELEKLKDQHAKELESLQDRHERENDRLAGAKEKESEDDTINKKRDAERKSAEKERKNNTESVELGEGKLVSDIAHVIDVILAAMKKQLQKEIAKNQEKGIGMLNTVGSFVGYKVTDKEQDKNKLFLKFGEEVEMEDALTEALSPKDKKVIDAFYDGKEMSSNTVKSVGDKLETTGMGAQVILKRHQNKFRVFAVIDSRRVQSIMAYIKKSYPKNTVIEQTEVTEGREKGPKQLTNPNKEVMVVKKNKVIVIDKKDQDKYLRQGWIIAEDRDYKKEYENYHSDPEQIKRRAKRNEARRTLKNRKDIKGKDVHHKDNNPMNNDKSNLSIVSQKFNRTEPRLRTEKLDKTATIKDWINDFKNSDAPQFKGQDAEQIKKMAVAAFYANQKKG